MKRSIFDASVLVKLVHDEAGTPAAHAYFEECATQPIVPDWAMLECAQALWRKALAGDLTTDQALRRYETLEAIDLDLVGSSQLAGSALSLALVRHHPVYDCAYVALALAEGATLVTADTKQREVAEACGVEVRWVGAAS